MEARRWTGLPLEKLMKLRNVVEVVEKAGRVVSWARGSQAGCRGCRGSREGLGRRREAMERGEKAGYLKEKFNYSKSGQAFCR